MGVCAMAACAMGVCTMDACAMGVCTMGACAMRMCTMDACAMGGHRQSLSNWKFALPSDIRAAKLCGPVRSSSVWLHRCEHSAISTTKVQQ